MPYIGKDIIRYLFLAFESMLEPKIKQGIKYISLVFEIMNLIRI